MDSSYDMHLPILAVYIFAGISPLELSRPEHRTVGQLLHGLAQSSVGGPFSPG